VRSDWAIENNLHWTLDVTFNEDQSRLRAGHGAKNMAVVRQRQAKDKDKGPIIRRRKRASWDPKYLLENPSAAPLLTSTRCLSTSGAKFVLCLVIIALEVSGQLASARPRSGRHR
jgi:hypothetical protein